MGSVRRALQRAVKVGAAAADTVRRPSPGVVVLIYHRVGGRSSLELDLPLGLFEEQMARLADSGRVVSLGRALELLVGPPGAGAEPAVVVTFDDGTADFVDAALPVLERHRVPATLYAATAFIDEGIPFPDDGTPVSWAGLADARSTGLVEIGSHTHRHLLLDRLDPAGIAEELDRSIDLIGTHVGEAPLDFAYPKAVPGSAEADRAVRARFRSAALAGTRPNVVGATDPWTLARSPVQTSDGMSWFARKLAGGMGLEDDLRRTLNRRRYAGATS